MEHTKDVPPGASLGDDLRERWTALVGGLPAAAATLEHLLAAYGDPVRRHHDLRHLTEVLDVVDELAPLAEDADAVLLAAWFHDVVYEPARGDNEEASAALAEALLPSLGVPAARVAAVGRLVRLTATHGAAPDDADGVVLCDADLAVLGAGVARYADYAAGVRVEYAHVPDDAFATGRTVVLSSMLERNPLFRTPAAQQRWEDAARRNMAAELRWLSGGPAVGGR